MYKSRIEGNKETIFCKLEEKGKRKCVYIPFLIRTKENSVCQHPTPLPQVEISEPLERFELQARKTVINSRNLLFYNNIIF